jgi:glucosamine kinase
VPFFLGIDGGGTKTRCVLGDENSLLGTGNGSSCKVQRVGEACARDSLSAAIHEACVQTGISPGQITRTCAGVTGSGRPEIAGVMRDLVSSIVAGEIEIVGDVEIAFEDAFGTGPGVIVIAGTGSIAYGRNSSGDTARAGGWGHAISDEGSGYWIGIEAVRSALRANDREENPGLLKNVVDGLGTNDFEDFVVRVNSDPPADFAALFPVVLSAAEAGDTTANEILDRAGCELANVGEVVIQRIFRQDENFMVATHGGIFSNSVHVRSVFVQQLQSRYGKWGGWISCEVDPARGALSRARRGFATATAKSNAKSSSRR